MTRLSVWRMACIIALLYAATAVSGHAQTLSLLVTFDGPNGAVPQFSSLVQGADGNLYGTTGDGGTVGYGTVFKVTPGGALTTLYSFCSETSCLDGAYPNAGLVLATNGNFYGTTYNGGTGSCLPRRPGCGTVFTITPAGNLTTIYTFCTQPGCSDGDAPIGSLIQAIDGDLYGTTTQGGASNGQCPLGCGTIFKISPRGVLTTLHAFDYSDGYAPLSGVIQATDGNFYGTTSDNNFCNPNCGTGYGTLFRLTPHGAFTTMHSFSGIDGANPFGALVQANDGRFYGTTYFGGNENPACYLGNGCGTVFRMSLDGGLETLYAFCSQPNCSDSHYPAVGLIQATDGNLYGTTVGEGTNFAGTLFTITQSDFFTTLYEFGNSDGAYPDNGLFQGTNGALYGTTTFGGGYGDGTLFNLDMGLGPFVTFVRAAGKVGQTGGILGQGFTGTSSVSLSGIPASFTVVSDTFIRATVPVGATTGYVTVTTPSGNLTSNVPFHVIR